LGPFVWLEPGTTQGFVAAKKRFFCGKKNKIPINWKKKKVLKYKEKIKRGEKRRMQKDRQIQLAVGWPYGLWPYSKSSSGSISPKLFGFSPLDGPSFTKL
jgi:hypothetical protein